MNFVKSSLMILGASYHVGPVVDEDFRGPVRAQLQSLLHQRNVLDFSAGLDAKWSRNHQLGLRNRKKKKSGENIIVSASSIMMYFSILAGVRCYNCHYTWQISFAIILLPGAGSNITCAPLTCMWWFHRKQEACNTLGVFLQKLRHFSLDFGAATSTPDIHTLLHLSAE